MHGRIAIKSLVRREGTDLSNILKMLREMLKLV
jgi:hypothetical protein